MAKVPFEKSKRDVEPKGMKEGSKREEAFDRKQQKAPPPKGAPFGGKGFPAKAPPFAAAPAKKAGRGR